MEGCDISSRSGSGVGVEGTSTTPHLARCRVHDCRNHGVALFGGLDGAAGGGGTMQGCTVVNNGLAGVLVRSGAMPLLQGNSIKGNKGWGISIQVRSGGARSGQAR